LTLHERLMEVLEYQLGHRILAEVEAAKIACSVQQADATVQLDFLDSSLKANVTVEGMHDALQTTIARVVQCALECVHQSGLPAVDVVYLTGGSSALTPLMEAMRQAMPLAKMVQGDRFGGVAAGLAYAGKAHVF
jgi:hypothetical chaperone protein